MPNLFMVMIQKLIKRLHTRLEVTLLFFIFQKCNREGATQVVVAGQGTLLLRLPVSPETLSPKELKLCARVYCHIGLFTNLLTISIIQVNGIHSFTNFVS